MDYKQYANTLYYQFIYKQRGYQTKRGNDWQQVRLIAYTIYAANTESKDRIDMYDWMPLQNDPSKKDRDRDALKQRKKEIKESERRHKELAEQARRLQNIIIDGAGS